MNQLITYLTFNGHCREAMQFYQRCLGGNLTFQTVGESPLANDLPGAMQACILHATLTNGQIVLMATDLVGEQGWVSGNSISILIDCAGEAEMHNCYEQLCTGGSPTHPIVKTHWGGLFGELTDKYGIHWLLKCNEQENHYTNL